MRGPRNFKVVGAGVGFSLAVSFTPALASGGSTLRNDLLSSTAITSSALSYDAVAARAADAPIVLAQAGGTTPTAKQPAASPPVVRSLGKPIARESKSCSGRR